jgi:two-component system CheB/CheR fusion protein
LLLIEDNSDAAETLRSALELAGHNVAVEGSGSAGIERARELKPDVILCDIGLPEMDGYAVARTVRADPDLAHVWLVALTGYARSEDRAAAREAGFDAHLAKPTSIQDILKHVDAPSSID